MRPLLLLLALPVLVAASPAVERARPAAVAAPVMGGAVALAARPGTPLDAAARQLVGPDIVSGRQSGDVPLVLTGTAALGTASTREALFVQLQSARECGSAGCDTTVYLWMNGAWRRVLDGVGGRITAGPSKTRGMADLVTDDNRYVWTGHEYRDTDPAPAIDLRPRRPRR